MDQISAKNETKFGIHCGVCGEPVYLNEWEIRHTTFKLCPECIKAIKWAKSQMNLDKKVVIESKTSPIKLSEKAMQTLKEKKENRIQRY